MQTPAIRVQIVDDHTLFREGLSAILRAEPDIEVVSLAGSVSEAVESALATRPEMILMDYNLPDGTGLEATRQILAVLPECKIIFLTMSDKGEDLMAAIHAGAKGYLLKDESPSRLVAALRAVRQGDGALSGPMARRLMESMAASSSSPAPAQLSADLAQLTPRELEVLQVLTADKSNLEIANTLFISENTVRFHIHSILNKLKLPSREEAARYARERGIGPVKQ